MIQLLSAIGRSIVVLGAGLTIVACMVAGYSIAHAQETLIYGNFVISGGGQITPREFLYVILGCGVGIIIAGSVFGAIATLYDIRDSLRQLAQATPDSNLGSPPPARVRREPRIG